MSADPLEDLRRSGDPLAALTEARRMQAELPGLVRELGRAARAAGRTWREVADAGGWSTPSAARYTIVEATDDALAGARQRQASRRMSQASDMVGVSTTVAADRLGVTRARVNQMVAAGELESVTVTTSGGRTLHRVVDARVVGTDGE